MTPSSSLWYILAAQSIALLFAARHLVASTAVRLRHFGTRLLENADGLQSVVTVGIRALKMR
jgi:hypothetical protein